ncbi:MAG: DegV family protein [Lachnospiraceae bacterium]|nr:DegV family protein [Lachnospiraceae bacterium]
MRKFQIISDSACDLPKELVSRYRIRVIPFYVSFNQKVYLKESEEIGITEFYSILNEGKTFPKTSLPSVQDYIDCFEQCIEHGEDVLCFCITDKFSGSYASAVNAREIVLEDYPEAQISVMNTSLVTAAQGLLVIEAAKMREAGYTIDEILPKMHQLKETARIMFTVDTLEYLQKGGRIGKVTALAGNMLNLKPMIVVREGELNPYSNVRGRKKSLKKEVEMVEEFFTENRLNYEDYEFCIDCTDFDSPDVAYVKDKLEKVIGRELSLPLFHIGVTIGTYTGPNTVGCCFIRKFTR